MNQQPTFFEQPPSRVDSPRFTAQTETAPKKTRTELVIDYFQAHPNEWIDGMRFAEFAGQYAWRSRIADARARGLVIENRQRTVKGEHKWFQVSEYRWVPSEGE